MKNEIKTWIKKNESRCIINFTTSKVILIFEKENRSKALKLWNLG